MTALAQRFTWTSVINRLRAPDAAPKVRVQIDYIVQPRDEGMEQLDTPTDGSYIDYGIRIIELTWCIVRHYSDAYDVQLIRLQPSDVALAKRDESTQAMAGHSQISIANLPREASGIFVTLQRGGHHTVRQNKKHGPRIPLPDERRNYTRRACRCAELGSIGRRMAFCRGTAGFGIQRRCGCCWWVVSRNYGRGIAAYALGSGAGGASERGRRRTGSSGEPTPKATQQTDA